MEISISEGEKSRLRALFRDLEAITERNFHSPDIKMLGPNVESQAQKLEIVTVGVSMSSLEQVFIKIGDECDAVINKSGGANKKVERRKLFSGLIAAKKRRYSRYVLFLIQITFRTTKTRIFENTNDCDCSHSETCLLHVS